MTTSKKQCFSSNKEDYSFKELSPGNLVRVSNLTWANLAGKYGIIVSKPAFVGQEWTVLIEETMYGLYRSELVII